MSYDNWRKRLDIYNRHSTVAARREAVAKLKINFSQPGPEDEGYYRKPITQKQPNGQSRVIGWVPVAYFLPEGGSTLCGFIGAGASNRDMTPQECTDEELWSYVVANPISYQVYEAVADKGEPWPDQPETVAEGYERLVAAPERVIERTDNLPPEVDPLTEFRESIENATLAALANFKTITSDEQAAQAEGAKNRIAELRLAADKTGRALYDPPYREYKRLHALWTPMVDVAKQAEDTLVLKVRIWRENERKRLAAAAAERDRAERVAQAERERAARDEEEAQQRAADRAIAAGEPEPAPVVEKELPMPEPAPVVEPVAPPKPTYGARRVKATEAWHFDGVVDWAKVIEHYKDSLEVKALLTQLSQRDVKAGREIPGTNRHWGIV